MIYVSHFAFDCDSSKPQHGYATALIEADNLATAIAGFRELLVCQQKEHRLFPADAQIYLVNCTEVRAQPDKGMVLQYWSLSGSDYTEISTSLPGIGEARAISAQWAKPPVRPGQDGELIPFLTISTQRDAIVPG